VRHAHFRSLGTLPLRHVVVELSQRGHSLLPLLKLCCNDEASERHHLVAIPLYLNSLHYLVQQPNRSVRGRGGQGEGVPALANPVHQQAPVLPGGGRGGEGVRVEGGEGGGGGSGGAGGGGCTRGRFEGGGKGGLAKQGKPSRALQPWKGGAGWGGGGRRGGCGAPPLAARKSKFIGETEVAGVVGKRKQKAHLDVGGHGVIHTAQILIRTHVLQHCLGGRAKLRVRVHLPGGAR
jgi:hypothetical protein